MDLTAAINLIIAILAVVLSLLALWTSRNQGRADAYARTQEYLMAADLQAARAKVYSTEQAGKLPVDDDEYALVMRAFGTFEAIAQMARRNVVQRDWILDEWHHNLRRMRIPYESVLAQRAQWHSFNPWPILDELIREAELYKTDRSCCIGPTLAERAANYSGPLLPRA